MHDFWDKEKKQLEMAASLDNISVKFVIGDICVRPYILFYIHGPAVLHCFNHKII